MSSKFESLSIEKSFIQKSTDVKTNLIKMLVNRNLIDKKNQDSKIDKLIANQSLEFLIELDNDTNYNTTIQNKQIYIKIFNYQINTTTKGSEIVEFMKNNNNNYKILIVNDIDKKSEKFLNLLETEFELFKFNELQINLVDHVLVSPHICLTEEQATQVKEEYNMINKDIPFILDNDIVARYYRMKVGNICQIIRPSLTSGFSFNYRLVVKAK